jgi:hypothetical protein
MNPTVNGRAWEGRVAIAAPINLGFLTVLQEANGPGREQPGYLGGYLVTNNWGRPLEFRLSTAVQPNRVQQILYASTLRAYICADLIGKTLLDKTSSAAQLVVTDTRDVLDLRRRVEVPVVWLAPFDATPPVAGENCVRQAEGGRPAIFAHPHFPVDVAVVRELLAGLEGVDLAEPFARIREAIPEARKMGVVQKAA